jgi:hypothetical protein
MYALFPLILHLFYLTISLLVVLNERRLHVLQFMIVFSSQTSNLLNIGLTRSKYASAYTPTLIIAILPELFYSLICSLYFSLSFHSSTHLLL